MKDGKKIKASLKILFDVEEHRETIEDFAIRKYNEKFNGRLMDMWFDTFEVVSENEIKIWYSYGGGDMEMRDCFNVKLDEIKTPPEGSKNCLTCKGKGFKIEMKTIPKRGYPTNLPDSGWVTEEIADEIDCLECSGKGYLELKWS